jgi:hypothetical protein
MVMTYACHLFLLIDIRIVVEIETECAGQGIVLQAYVEGIEKLNLPIAYAIVDD